MLSLPQAVQRIVDKSPFIKETLSVGLINNTSLARYIKKDVENSIGRTASLSAIRSAIDRMPLDQIDILDKSLSMFMKQLGDINVRSDLIDCTFKNSSTLLQAQVNFLEKLDQSQSSFISTSTGINETTMIISKTLVPDLDRNFVNEQEILRRDNLAAISIMLPSKNLDVYGVYYSILKQLAWKGINVVEIISTSHEITLVVGRADVESVFSIFMAFKS